jgi:rfaE bifunctional protein nucleotidyltransferase chain/domain
MQQSFFEHDKILDLNQVEAFRNQCRCSDQRFVLTNGCFDLLHPGHVAFLATAATKGDHLCVGVNSDFSVKSLKGETRPLFPQQQRAFMLAALEAVSIVFVFETKRFAGQIALLQPDVYVKAGDYSIESMCEEERLELKQCGASIEFLPFVSGCGTSRLIKQIRKLPGEL